MADASLTIFQWLIDWWTVPLRLHYGCYCLGAQAEKLSDPARQLSWNLDMERNRNFRFSCCLNFL